MVAAGGAIAEGFKNARNGRNSGQRLLRGEGTKSDVVVDKRGLRLPNDLLVRLHIRNTLPIAVPESIEQLGAEFFTRRASRDCLMRSGNWRVGHREARGERTQPTYLG